MESHNNSQAVEKQQRTVSRRHLLGVTGAGLLGATLGVPSVSARVDGPGVLMPIGGGFEPENERLHQEIIDLGGGEDSISLAIMPTASGTPTTSAEAYRDDFIEYGVPEEQIEIIEVATEDDPNTDEDESTWIENADDEDWADTVREANVILYTGGNQLRITEALKHDDGSLTAVAQAIQDVYDDGGAITGSSAGAAIMSDPMIGAGQSFGALKDGVSYEDTYYDDDDNRVFVTDGFEYLDEGLCDQHFMARGRFGRLVRAMWHEDTNAGIERNEIGYGVGENTGFIFDPSDNTARVSGEYGVTIIDLSEAYEVDTGTDALHLEDIIVHFLTHGDVFHYDDGTVTHADEKDWNCIEDPYYSGNSDSSDLFAANEIRDLMTEELVDNTESSVGGTASVQGRDLEMEFWQDGDTRGFWGRSYPEDDRGRYMVSNVRAAVWPDERDHDDGDDDNGDDDEDSGTETEPTIDQFDVQTRSSGPWSRATVDWAVSDDDGDLESVTTELLANGTVLDAETSSVSGSSATGEHEPRTRDDPDTVRLTVTDEAGNETTDSKSY
ncbi:cyanophycinase [Halobacteria archaeon AArc-curdl1]|uniref:Cyanophycinase n=1 Tax=Natronosalvus hydrolyticus TaxID=2979988 RepID=A0AAP2Z8E7_9EURY|nr:cyanophycinase [Halobacteria archaeon AArc-curdl1]